MTPATTEKRTYTKRSSHKLKITRGAKIQDEASLRQLLLDSIGDGGYKRQILNICRQKLSEGITMFYIAVDDDQTGKPIEEKKLIHNITTWVNKDLKAENSSVRIRWVEKTGTGELVQKFVGMPAKIYKEIVGGR